MSFVTDLIISSSIIALKYVKSNLGVAAIQQLFFLNFAYPLLTIMLIFGWARIPNPPSKLNSVHHTQYDI